jgi:hypothetical protein
MEKAPSLALGLQYRDDSEKRIKEIALSALSGKLFVFASISFLSKSNLWLNPGV